MDSERSVLHLHTIPAPVPALPDVPLPLQRRRKLHGKTVEPALPSPDTAYFFLHHSVR